MYILPSKKSQDKNVALKKCNGCEETGAQNIAFNQANTQHIRLYRLQYFLGKLSRMHSIQRAKCFRKHVKPSYLQKKEFKFEELRYLQGE